jgi:UDP-glucose 4-epimerase
MLLDQGRAEESISIYGDGKLGRTFTHVGDLCMQITESILDARSCNQVFNIRGEAADLISVAELIAARFNKRISFVSWPEEARRMESGPTVFSSEKIQSITSRGLDHDIRNWIHSLPLL